MLDEMEIDLRNRRSGRTVGAGRVNAVELCRSRGDRSGYRSGQGWVASLNLRLSEVEVEEASET